jgi:hypothetical protein
MGGTCIAAMGRFASFITETGIDFSGLGRWTWLYVGDGGKKTHIVTAYQPCNPWKRTMGETVWDQQVCYFESCGKVRHPRIMFQANVLNLISLWKVAGDKIMLFGDFNENIYSRILALTLLGNEFQMSELCWQTSGIRLLSTHIREQVPIDGVFATFGVTGTAGTLLPSRVDVGNHRVFLIDIDSDSLLGDVFP